MGRQEPYARAMQSVAKRRQRAESLALERNEELYEAHAHLAELSRRRNATGAEAAMLAAGKNREGSHEKLEEMHRLQKEHDEALQELGLLPSDLEPQWFCKMCSDTGRTEAGLCACVQEEIRRLCRDDVSEIAPLRRCRFENFDLNCYAKSMDGAQVSPRELMRHNLENCRIYAQEFDLSSESLYLYGDAGLGKTHLALSIANVVLERGFDVLYVSAQKAFMRLDEERRNWTSSGYFNTLLRADLLVLDDLGTEFLNAYLHSRFYELVNTRMHHRPTIYTTNIGSQALLQQRYTEKISSRLLGECHRVRFIGKDIRLQNRQSD